MSHDRVGALAIFLSDFIEARYVGISLLLLGVADEATIGQTAQLALFRALCSVHSSQERRLSPR
jgi:hypothetical protein